MAMFNRFTERARKVILLAKEEAKRFNHDYIGRNIQLHEEIKTMDSCISKVDNNDIKEDKLYHLLTNTSTFNIDNLRFYDYNSLINLHLGKW